MTTRVSNSLRKRSTMTPPSDVLRSVLLRLPVKSLLRLQSVCKEWRSLIQDSDFRHSYSHKERLIVVSDRLKCSNIRVSSVSHNLRLEKIYDFTEHLSFQRRHAKGTYIQKRLSVNVLGSCNGLVLLSVNTHIFLWNPSTRQCTKVLELQCFTDSASGFYYDSSTEDYKALLIRPDFVIVASLRQKEWREVPRPHELLLHRMSLHFHNIFHLVVDDVTLTDTTLSYSGRQKIVYFDPESEKFELLPTPKVTVGTVSIIRALGVIEGCLSMALDEIGSIQILAMKEYRVAESWVTLYTISHYDLCFGNDNTVKFYSLKNNVLTWNWGHGEIFAMDMKTKEREIVSSEIGDDENIIDTCLYVESFASPHEYAWIDEQHKQFSKKI